jgi:anti-sigma B factor antagonist
VSDADAVLLISTDIDSSPTLAVLQLRGEIDMATAGALQDALLAFEPGACRTVSVDLEDVTFIDSHGLRVLIGAQRTLAEREIELVVTRAGPQAARLFEITGTADLLTAGAAVTPARTASS